MTARERQRALPVGEALFNAAADGLLLLDRKRTIVAANPAFERMTGWRREEIVGKTDCFSLVHCRDADGALICEHPEECPGLVALNVAEQTPYTELTMLTKEGMPLLVSASYAPVTLNGDRPTYTIAIYRDITEQKRVRDRLQQLAVTDELTGLYSRRYFHERCAEEIKRADRHGHPLSLLLADVDDLKGCNDRYGHLKGDALLALIGRVFKSAVRETDIPARYGGDEFAVLLLETDKRQAMVVAEKAREKTERLSLSAQGDAGYHWTVSIGVATFPEDAREVKNLIRRADLALYRGKRHGGNRVAAA